MGRYIDETINAGEDIIYRGKMHWATLIPNIILILILMLASSGNPNISPILFSIGILLSMPTIIRMFTDELAFTNKRVLGKRRR